MPYVITTATPLRGEPVHESLDRITRTAVATLEEAREAAAEVAGTAYSDEWIMAHANRGTVAPLIDAAWDLPESGGTVGPLPDGTVIEVRRRSWPDLQADAGLGHRMPLSDANILSVFNTGAYLGGLKA